jgi:hypothetical protein
MLVPLVAGDTLQWQYNSGGTVTYGYYNSVVPVQLTVGIGLTITKI